MSLPKIYYSTGGYWKGYSAIPKLADAAKITKAEARRWLEKQAMWQIYLPRPKYMPRPHWVVTKPNAVHQADLLFLPHDKVGRKTYNYALVVVDVASRYKDAEPLTTKGASEVAAAFERIYSRKLRWPKTLSVDPGSEFKGEVEKVMERHKVVIRRSVKGNHRAQAFAERANRTLSEKLFSHQYAQEMVDGKNWSRVWVRRLPEVMETLNSQVTRLTGKKALDAYDMKEVETMPVTYDRPVGEKEERLPANVLVRYLYAPGEEAGTDERKRATDAIWSVDTFHISSAIVSPGQPVSYRLEDGPRRRFVREELQVVPVDTEAPPQWVLDE